MILPLAAACLSFLLRTNSLGSIVLFLIVPSIYLSILRPQSIRKAGLFALATAIPSIIVVDYIMDVTRQWLVTETVFSSRFLGYITYETIIWAVFSVYIVVMFYEYFFEPREQGLAWRSRMNILVAVLVAMLAIFFALRALYPAFFASISYAYLIVGTITVFIPTLIELFRKPRLLPKFLMTAVYFFYVDIIYEITALKLGWWIFPSAQYIGKVSILGVSFPVEELLFWMMFLSAGTLAYYEPFDDDEK